MDDHAEFVSIECVFGAFVFESDIKHAIACLHIEFLHRPRRAGDSDKSPVALNDVCGEEVYFQLACFAEGVFEFGGMPRQDEGAEEK